MKPIRIFLTVLVVLLLILAMTQVIRWRQDNNPDYQLTKLKSGTTLQKVNAMEFVANKGINSAIPLLVQYIDSDDYAMRGDAAWSLSCVSTKSLGTLTKLDFGETCNSDKLKSDTDISTIKKLWKDWYTNEYSKWIETQAKS